LRETLLQYFPLNTFSLHGATAGTTTDDWITLWYSSVNKFNEVTHIQK
jgi:hypothetical protein